MTDEQWSREVRAAAEDEMCQFCGLVKGTGAAHAVPRNFQETRHDPRNGKWLCVVCHAKIDNNSKVARRLRERLWGKELLAELYRKARGGDGPCEG